MRSSRLFIEKFLRKLCIPKFRFLAPGLRLASPEELAGQPFKDFVPPPPPLQIIDGQIHVPGYTNLAYPGIPNPNPNPDLNPVPTIRVPDPNCVEAPNQIRNRGDRAVHEYK
jgi:hypothetical protein